MFHRMLATASAALVLCASAAFAGTGAEGYFQIYNNTDDNTVIGFYTNDGGGWSSNWLSSRIGPDESARAEFTDDSGSCAQTFRVGWLGTDGGEVLDEPIDIDICEASNVYLDDNEIYYD